MPSKPRRSPVSTDRRRRKTPENSDHGTPERWQHSGRLLEQTERPGITAARATEEHIIDILVLRKAITQTQSIAAFKFKLDYQRAGLSVHTTSSYSPMIGGGDYSRRERERSDIEEAAYQRWRNAVRHLGLGFSGAVITVTCNDQILPPRDMELLRKGLEKLVEWYRLPKES